MFLSTNDCGLVREDHLLGQHVPPGDHVAPDGLALADVVEHVSVVRGRGLVVVVPADVLGPRPVPAAELRGRGGVAALDAHAAAAPLLRPEVNTRSRGHGNLSPPSNCVLLHVSVCCSALGEEREGGKAAAGASLLSCSTFRTLLSVSNNSLSQLTAASCGGSCPAAS